MYLRAGYVQSCFTDAPATCSGLHDRRRNRHIELSIDLPSFQWMLQTVTDRFQSVDHLWHSVRRSLWSSEVSHIGCSLDDLSKLSERKRLQLQYRRKSYPRSGSILVNDKSSEVNFVRWWLIAKCISCKLQLIEQIKNGFSLNMMNE